MTIYTKRTPSQIYRKIYEDHYGPIPKEDNGRTYEIHHIDGDDSNNDPSNLVALTLQEHYDLHYSQGDYQACRLMALQRMNKTPEEISELNRLAQLKLLEEGRHHFIGDTNPSVVASKNGTHHFLDSDFQKETQRKRIEGGTHNFLDADFQKEIQRKRIENGTYHFTEGHTLNEQRVNDGTHNFLGADFQKEVQRKRIENGTHHFLDSDFQKEIQRKRIENGTHHFLGENSPTQQKWTCPSCGKSGKGMSNLVRWHSNCQKNGLLEK